jgi:hypothetical protein
MVLLVLVDETIVSRVRIHASDSATSVGVKSLVQIFASIDSVNWSIFVHHCCCQLVFEAPLRSAATR